MRDSTEKELLLLLHEKVDKISDNIHEIEKVQVKQELGLSEHIRRTEIAEERLDVIEQEVKPILSGLSFLKIIAKFGATFASLAYAAAKFFR
jgi:hypothetical protein